MRLKELREQNKLTQLKVASDLQINNVTYGRYELNVREPDIETLCKLADYYNVSLDYLCEHETKAVELPPNLTADDKQAIFDYIALPELKKAVIRGEIKAIALV